MKKYLLALGIVALLAGCSSEVPVEPQDKGADANWQTLNAGDFTVLAPAGWAFAPQMGIDSTVGQFFGDGMVLVFDYGVNTADFSHNSVYFEDPDAYTVTQETIDGFDAKIYIPKEAGTEKPTVLSIENVNGTEPCTAEVCVVNQENFEMLGDNLSVEQVALVVQIFKTVDFK